MKKIVVIAFMMLFGFISAQALTTAGTDVNNTATLNYDVGGVTQSSVSASDTGFVVDRKIDVIVANQDNTDGVKTVNVTPNQQDAILTYAINNAGNDNETYKLTLADAASGDQFDPSSCEISIDGGANWVLATTEPNLPINQETNTTVQVRCDIPASIPAAGGVQNGDTGTVVLTATVQGRTKANNDLDNPAAIQDIFADGAGVTDGANNGDYSDTGTYLVVSADLSMVKTSIVTDDPVYNGGTGGSTEPHRIPGATVRYCFTVDNNGAATASNVVITDDFTTDNKDKLTVTKAGNVVQALTTACDCAAITDTSGNIGTTSAITTGSATINTNERACAYIEATIN